MEPSPLIEASESNIADFFRGQNVLITGSTGFMGKVLVEKMLRSCPDVDTVYLLMRSKKNENIHDRADKLFSDPVFKRLGKAEVAKVIPISGDISEPGLGLSPESRKLLTERVSTVFHCAATVSFAMSLRETLITNLRGTHEVLQLCKEMQHLKVLLYVSTAYSHCVRNPIEETFYETPMTARHMINSTEWMTNEQMEVLAPHIIGKWPNYYTFSKALAENLVKSECGDLPVAIFRPSIVVGAMTEPIPGWIDNVNGPSGIVVGSAMGVIRCFNCDLDKVVDIVPVDISVNAMIATAWDVAINRKTTTIFNYTVGSRNPLKWRQFMEMLVVVGLDAPPAKCIWHYFLLAIKSPLLYKVAVFFLHNVPGFLMDVASLLTGKKRRMVRLYNKIETHMHLASFFALRQWDWSDKNVQATIARMSEHDRELFPCDVSSISWLNYMRSYYNGLRKFLLKDDEDTIPDAIKRYNRMYYLHRFFQLLLTVSFLFVSSKLVSGVIHLFT